MLLFILIVLLAPACYCYYKWSSLYWRRRGVPAPHALPFLGNSPELLVINRPGMFQLHKWGEEYGPTFGYKEGIANVLVTRDVNMLQEIFVKQFNNFYPRRNAVLQGDVDKEKNVHLFFSRGARWKRLRAITSPAFSVSSLRKILPVLDECAAQMTNLMIEKHSPGEVFNIHEHFMEYTMDTICRLVTGDTQCRQFERPVTRQAQKIFLRNLNSPFFHLGRGLPFLLPIIRVLYKRYSQKMMEGEMQMKDDIEKAVRKRVAERESGITRGDEKESEDFIDLYLDATADIDFTSGADFDKSAPVSKKMTIEEVIHNCFLFLLAGFETTSNALAYTVWMLVKHPSVQCRVYEEIDAVCGSGDIGYDELTKLRYTEAVLKETLRFYPVAAMANARTCMSNTRVGEIELEKGTVVIADTLGVHFDAEVWGEDASEFNPERWLDESRRVPPVAYMAFGGGPRVCIGQRLAILEEKMALVHLMRRFIFHTREEVSDH